VKIDEDGSASILTSTVEVGQGSHTILTQIVSDTIGLEKDRVTVSFADTDVTPYDTSTTASRSTFHMGNAVRLAAEDAKQQILNLAVPVLHVGKDGLQLRSGIVVAPDGRSVTISQVLRTTFGAGAERRLGKRSFCTPGYSRDGGDRRPLDAYSTMSVFHTMLLRGRRWPWTWIPERSGCFG